VKTAFIRILGLVVALQVTGPVFADTIHKMRAHHAHHKESTLRVVFEMAAQPQFKYSLHQAARQLRLDVHDTDLAPGLSLQLPKNPIVGSVYPLNHSDSLRLVFVLQDRADARVFTLPPAGESSYRLVLDFKPSGGSPIPQGPEQLPEAAIAKGTGHDGRNRSAPSAHSETPEKTIIAIDAGHGGRDIGAPGAQPAGASAHPEKYVTLDVALRLKRLLDGYSALEIVLIRDRDVFVSLPERVSRARKAKADYLISIHADAHRDSSAKGASIFVRPDKINASTQTLKWLVNQEGNSHHGSHRHVHRSLGDQAQNVQNVLGNMIMDDRLTAAFDLADVLLNQLGQARILHAHRIKRGNFHVLKKTLDIPSVLVELGFLSNPEEAAKLRSANYRQKLAEQIARGIVIFTRQQKAARSARAVARIPVLENTYRISPGDTLFKLAKRFDVSPQIIMQHNGLVKANLIRAGDTLFIP